MTVREIIKGKTKFECDICGEDIVVGDLEEICLTLHGNFFHSRNRFDICKRHYKQCMALIDELRKKIEEAK